MVELIESITIPAFVSDDNTMPKGGGIETWNSSYKKAYGLTELPENPVKLFEGYLKAAGFVDVRTHVRKIPFGTWPKLKKKKVTPQSS